MPRPLATLALWTAVTGLAQAATPPTVQDFTGTWRIAAIIGASEGGVTGADPKRMLGKHVQWTATNVRSPKGDCHLQHPALTPMPNRSLETGVWGGQTISELKLSKTDLAKAFGAQQTPVFQDPSGCANAVLIDHEHMVDAFGSGWIFRLDRVPNSQLMLPTQQGDAKVGHYVGRAREIMEDILSSLGVLRRDSWGASPPAKPLAPDWDYEAVVIHNTGHGHIDTMKKIQTFDFADRGWEDISYHYGITANGAIMEGRQIIYKGADVKNQNTGKIGVVCIGDYDGGLKSWAGGHGYDGDPITTPMLTAMKRLTVRLQLAFPTIKYFGGHIEYGDTADCPGSKMLPVVASMRQDLGLTTPIKRPGL